MKLDIKYPAINDEIIKEHGISKDWMDKHLIIDIGED